MTKQFIITHVYDKLLRGTEAVPVGLYHLHLLTAAQLTRLHYSMGSYKYVRQNLNNLADHGYVIIRAVPKETTRGPNYYTLGEKGFRYLKESGWDFDTAARAGKEAFESTEPLEHLIELNDVFIAALRVSTLDPRLYIAEYVHERELKRTPYKTMVHGQAYGLVPDGFLDFHVRREGQPDLRLPVLVEHDRGTEREQAFKRKIAAYRALLQGGVFKERFGNVTIIFTTYKDLKRVTDMRRWTWDEVHTDPSLIGRFRFALLPQPSEPVHLLFESRWYTLINDQPISLLGD